MRIRRRTWGAIALSLLLHAALFAWLGSRPPPPRHTSSAEPAQTIITFELQDTQPPPIAKAPEPPPQPPAPVKKPKRGKPSVKPSAQPSAPIAANPEPQPHALSPGVAQDAPAPSVPRLRSLVPDAPRIAEADDAAAAPISRGVTTVNDGRGPSKEAVAELQALQAKERVDGWIVEDKAQMRVANGLADDYFREMKHALEAGASKPPKDAAPQSAVAQKLFNNYVDQLQRFGATGSPSGSLAAAPLGREGTSPLGREEHRDPDMATVRHAQQQMGHLRSLADNLGGKLITIVEIRQGTDGSFADARIVTPSGNELFDAYVLATAPSSITLLPPLPEHIALRSPNGVRSLWSFEGLLEYRRKARELEVKSAEDAAYLAGAGLLSLLTGAPFEETTGDVYVMDLRNPKFRCRVQLLKLY